MKTQTYNQILRIHTISCSLCTPTKDDEQKIEINNKHHLIG